MAILNVPIKLRVDSLENWNNSTFILQTGEPALSKKEDGTYELKFGDGQRIYKELPIFGGNSTEEKENNSDLLVTLTSVENNQASATYEQIKTTINNKHIVAVIYNEEVYMLNKVQPDGTIEFRLNKSWGQKYLEISSSGNWYENSSSWQAINISIDEIEGLEATNVQDALTELKNNSGGGGSSQIVSFDDSLTLSPEGKLSVNTANDVEQDNTLPVTSAAVYTEIGNIEALLSTI